MLNNNHHICIHGHFYQPPRENPWLGVIEKQYSAFPYTNWNERIAAECYGALVSSPVRDEAGQIIDMYNCYAHMSLNVGPTLLEWLDKHRPGLIPEIAAGDRLHADVRGGHYGSMAQAYSHPILPLQNPRDRHTQIVWGVREFSHRFGRYPKGMWLPECAIDMDTVRNLIDHRIKFVILSPYQCSKIRQFGESEWRDVSVGGPDTRMPYRVFEVDGAGHTHFNRYIDVFFYDPGLSMKISFEHYLKRPADLERELSARFDEDAVLPQLVVIATDGEIYGHHEQGGEEALAKLFTDIAPRMGVYVSNLEQYLEENPPACEAKLWDGEDGKGSSWSCIHGVGRWHRDCGCHGGGPDSWTQEWRGYLREAFDFLEHEVSEVFEREGGKYLCDPWEAREDYISVLLDDREGVRSAFLERHLIKKLDKDQLVKVWELLEATRNAMLMYTSCGWFFDDISGIEPVQNMRYAIRAAELVETYVKSDLFDNIRKSLVKAVSNREEAGTGADIFDRDAMSTRYGPEQIAAATILCRIAGVESVDFATTSDIVSMKTSEANGWRTAYGVVSVTDNRTLKCISLNFFAVLGSSSVTGVVFSGYGENNLATKFTELDQDELKSAVGDDWVRLKEIPFAARERIVGRLLARRESDCEVDIEQAYERSRDMLRVFKDNRMAAPRAVLANASHVLEQRLVNIVRRVIADNVVREADLEAVKMVYAEAGMIDAHVDKSDIDRILCVEICRLVDLAVSEKCLESLEKSLSLLSFSEKALINLGNLKDARVGFWKFLQDIFPHMRGEGNDWERLSGVVWDVGCKLGFAESLLRQRLM